MDLDMLIAVRIAPCQSYNNPAERCMSLLNIALQNVALQRESMIDAYEMKVRSLSSLGKLRDAATRDPALKEALVESLEPVQAVLKQRFAKLKLHGEHVLVHDAAMEEEIEQSHVGLQIFSDDPDTPLACKTLQQASTRLKWFVDTHCRRRTFTFQKTQLTRLCELQAYTCGSSLFPELHELYGEVFVREALMCSTEIETSYYSAMTQKFLPICFYFGDSDILGAEEEPVLSLKKQYSVVRPICRGCLESGKAPATRNALRLKKK